ncbi:MAG: extracellular solute-binding protein [Pseudomonadota bacterium]
MTQDRNASAPSRRWLLKTGAALTGVLAAPAIVGRAGAQSGFDWKRFKGAKIEVSLAKGPRGDLVQKYRKEFEELTGITVGDEQIPEQQQRQKVLIEFTSGRTTFDVVMLALHVQKQLAAKGNWLEDLRPYLKDPALTAADYDFADFAAAGTDYGTFADGRIGAITTNLDYFVLYWNKELFAKKGVAYPKSYDELLEAVKTLHDPKAGISGWLGRGLKNANMAPWANFILSFGKDFIENGKLQTATPEGIASAEAYAKLVREFGPPGSVGFNWNECQSIFAQGKAAMWLDGIGFALPLEDPTKSRIVGKVGYGVWPPGPKAHRTALYGDGFGISRTTDKKGAGLALYPMGDRQADPGAPASRRLRLAAAQVGLHQPRDGGAFRRAARIPRRDDRVRQDRATGLPEIVAVTEFRDISASR